MGAGAPRACAPARRRDRGSKGKGGRDGGESPGLHKRISGGEESSGFALRAEGRGDRPGRSRIFEGLHPCPREGGALSPSTKKAHQRKRKRSHSQAARPVKRAAAGAQHSAAFRRDAGSTAPGERLKSDFKTRWYQFCICDIVSLLRMSILGVRMITEPVFKRGRHGQESKEGKEDRESHQEGGKEDVKTKEVVVSTTEKLRLRIEPRTQNKPLQRI
jgi:hypothetical protein